MPHQGLVEDRDTSCCSWGCREPQSEVLTVASGEAGGWFRGVLPRRGDGLVGGLRGWIRLGAACGAAVVFPVVGALIRGMCRSCGGDELVSECSAVLLGLAPAGDGAVALVAAGGVFERAGSGEGVG